MNFELDRYHNLHFWIFKRLNDELMQELNQHVGIFHRVLLLFQFFKLARSLQSIFYHVVGIRLGFLQIEKLKF